MKLKLISRSGGLIPGPLCGIILVVLIAATILTSKFNYLLFHSLSETYTIIVAVMIFILASKTYKYSEDTFLLFLGTAFLFIAVLDYLHMVSYYGMGVFQGYSPNPATQLWIAGCYFQGAAFMIAPVFINRRFSYPVVFGIFTFVTVSLIASIMWLRIFPACFVPGQGLTVFKIVSEYLICLMIMGGTLVLSWKKDHNRSLYLTIIISGVVTIVSHLSFTLYNDPYGPFNLLGHILTMAAYTLIFYGIIVMGLQTPFDTIFQKLKDNSVHDYLTGLFNRKGFIETTKKELTRARTDGRTLGVLLLDLDRFKMINDQFGHLVGDRVLKQFAELIRRTTGEKSITSRLGGDEFIVLVNGGKKELRLIEQKVRDAVKDWKKADATVAEMDVSIGASLWEPGQTVDIDCLVKKADQEMYREKQQKKTNGA